MATQPKISPYRRGSPKFPRDPERQMPSEVRTYFLDDAQLEELNQKYPPKKRELSGGEKSALIISNMNKGRAEKIKKMREEENEVPANHKEPKITQEQLLEECREHGHGFEAAEIIGEKYGLSKRTVYTYIGKWGIREALMSGNNPAEGKVVELEPEKQATEVYGASMEDEDDRGSTIDPGIKVGFTIEKSHIDAFQLKRSGRFEKGKVVNILAGIANMLKDEEDGEYMIYVDLCQR